MMKKPIMLFCFVCLSMVTTAQQLPSALIKNSVNKMIASLLKDDINGYVQLFPKPIPYRRAPSPDTKNKTRKEITLEIDKLQIQDEYDRKVSSWTSVGNQIENFIASKHELEKFNGQQAKASAIQITSKEQFFGKNSSLATYEIRAELQGAKKYTATISIHTLNDSAVISFEIIKIVPAEIKRNSTKHNDEHLKMAVISTAGEEATTATPAPKADEVYTGKFLNKDVLLVYRYHWDESFSSFQSKVYYKLGDKPESKLDHAWGPEYFDTKSNTYLYIDNNNKENLYIYTVIPESDTIIKVLLNRQR